MRKTMKLASRGKRLGAGLIDLSVPLAAYYIMITVFGISLVSSGNPYGFGNEFGYGYGYGYNYGYNVPQSGGSTAGIALLSFFLLAYLIAELVLYARGQSIGKAILGLQVVSNRDGKPFGFWKMMLRECIVKSASGGTFLLGYVWILIDDKNRGWHDKILDSYVVDLKETANMYQRSDAYTGTSSEVQGSSSADRNEEDFAKAALPAPSEPEETETISEAVLTEKEDNTEINTEIK